MAKKALGKGLQALLSLDEQLLTAEGLQVHEIPLKKISTSRLQPRKSFDKAQIQELAESIKAYGVIQPILVTQKNKSSYELIVGERRYRACQQIGIEKIPAIIQEFSDAKTLEIALIENIQRADLNAIEEALGYQQLIEKFQITQEALSQRIGKSRTAITNTLRLLKLPEVIQSAIISKRITEGHARALLGLKKPHLYEKFLVRIDKESLSVRQTERLVQAINRNTLDSQSAHKNPQRPTPRVPQAPISPAAAPNSPDAQHQHYSKALAKIFHTKVQIQTHKDHKTGIIQIHYSGEMQLHDILKYFGIE